MSNARTRSVFLKKKKNCLDLYGRHIVGFQQQTAVSVCATYGLHFPNERTSVCMCSTEFTSKLQHETEYIFCQSDVSPPTLTNCQTPNQSKHKLLKPPQIKNTYNTFILGANYIHSSNLNLKTCVFLLKRCFDGIHFLSGAAVNVISCTDPDEIMICGYYLFFNYF